MGVVGDWVKCSDEVASVVSLHGRCALAGRGLTFTTRPAASPFGPSAKPTFTSLREDVLSTKKVSKESDPCGALRPEHSYGGGFLFLVVWA